MLCCKIKKLSLLVMVCILAAFYASQAGATPPTLDDLWAGNAGWEVYSTNVPADVVSGGNNLVVYNGTWYLFYRYVNCLDPVNWIGSCGMKCRSSNDGGQTWSNPVIVLEAPLSDGDPLPNPALTDGDFFYDAGANKWRCLVQSHSGTGNWTASYFEKSGSNPMGLFSVPGGFTNPAVDSREIWDQITYPPSAPNDATALSGGYGLIFDEGTWEVIEKVGSTFYVTFHGYDGVKGYRSVATTTDFQSYTAAANDCIFDKYDTDLWNVAWQGGSSGVGATTTLKEGSYYYTMAEGCDGNLGGTADQNWTWGIFRSTSLTSTTWENWSKDNCYLNPVSPFEPHQIMVEWTYASLFKDAGTTYLLITQILDDITWATETRLYKLVWKPLIDNQSTWGNGFSFTTGFAYSTSEGLLGDVDYCAAGDGSEWADFAPTIPETGSYKVYATWTSGANHATNAPYYISYNGGGNQDGPFLVDQQQLPPSDLVYQGVNWEFLGTYSFNAGYVSGQDVWVQNNANGYVIADAAMFEPVETGFYDNFNTGNFTAGGWVNSGTECVSTATYRYGSSGYSARFSPTSAGVQDKLTKAFNTSGKYHIQVSFVFKTVGVEAGKKFQVQYSANGTSFTTVKEISGSTPNWLPYIVTLPTDAANNTNFKLRFTTSGYTRTSPVDYGCLDEVRILYN